MTKNAKIGLVAAAVIAYLIWRASQASAAPAQSAAASGQLINQGAPNPHPVAPVVDPCPQGEHWVAFGSSGYCAHTCASDPNCTVTLIGGDDGFTSAPSSSDTGSTPYNDLPHTNMQSGSAGGLITSPSQLDSPPGSDGPITSPSQLGYT